MSEIEEDGLVLQYPSLNVSDCSVFPGEVNRNNGSWNSPGTNRQRYCSEDVRPSRYDPYSQYKSEAKRLETFQDWPPGSVVSKEDLAKDGFIYLHDLDRTQCVFCHAIIRDWEQGDIVTVEHRKFSPDCAFAAGYDVGNFPLQGHSLPQPAVFSASNGSVNVFGGKVTFSDNGGFRVTGGEVMSENGTPLPIHRQLNQPDAKAFTSVPSSENMRYRPTSSVTSQSAYSNNVSAGHTNTNGLPSSSVINRPKYSNWENPTARLESFAEWPVTMQQTPAQLVRAGLLYMGKNGEPQDRCKCYWCGGELYDWEPNDDPMEEHAKWFPDCGYVRQQMGDEYVKYVKDKQLGLVDTPVGADFFSRPHILQVLHSGYTRDEVLALINKYGAEKLVDARTILQLLDYERRRTQGSVFYAQESEDVSMEEQEQETQVKTRRAPSEASYFIGSVDRLRPALPVSEAWGNSGASPPGRMETRAPVRFETTSSGAQNQSKPSSAVAVSQSPIQNDTKDPEDVETLRREYEHLKEQRQCKICMDADICITFLPCGHLATCEGCSNSVKECPICRRVIQQKFKTFWS